ncbi:globin domain-containing protein [Thiothrix lacustris]|uniref:nitric oxide dioxygenase n=1 Tax=Thiothrix lacustris TaxID=525917 RepID=A0ABY9MW23_9GAMM|nr:globin domain-containing protein [Thiothrix lacustris]WML92131.1 globin domain-containing protein [Thiothrix lacustris]
MITAESLAIVQATVGLVREHGTEITSTFYRSMFVTHPELKNLFNMSNQATGGQQQALASAVYAYAANINNPAVLEPVLSRIAHKHASLGIKPAQYTIVGKHLLGAVKTVLGDLATAEILAAWDEVYWLLACDLVAREATLYAQQSARLDKQYWRTLRIERIVQETPDIRSLYLVDPDGAKLPAFVAGQYVSIALENDGLQQIRQYSLSDHNSQTYWRITVKREAQTDCPDGFLSNLLHQLTVGDTLKAGIPYGDFVVQADNEAVALISAGVGITPMVSILNTLAKQNAALPIRFIHAARHSTQVALQTDVATAAQSLSDYRSVFFYETHDNVTTADEFVGRMNLEQVALTDLPEKTGYYLCGPLAFMRVQREWLQAQGVPAERIHYEVFGPDMFTGLQ